MRLHQALVDNRGELALPLLRFFLLKLQAVDEEISFLEALDFETFRCLGVQRAEVLKDVAFEAHDAVFFDMGIFAKVIHNLLFCVQIWNERAELHARVEVEE